jgi:hypothetical protein
MSSNRRYNSRIPLQIFLNQYVQDDPHRCMSYNLSPKGIYLGGLVRAVERPTPIMGLEFELPGTSEVIWARGEVRYDYRDAYLQGTGVEFTGMANSHERLVRDYVNEQTARRLRSLLETIQQNRSIYMH